MNGGGPAMRGAPCPFMCTMSYGSLEASCRLPFVWLSAAGDPSVHHPWQHRFREHCCFRMALSGLLLLQGRALHSPVQQQVA